ncbi:MAG: hypothetical protein JWM10_3970 [Myxococcaceae bacterium]|nr:hypothetical protein [Myxococcaceae bacterium]
MSDPVRWTNPDGGASSEMRQLLASAVPPVQPMTADERSAFARAAAKAAAAPPLPAFWSIGKLLAALALGVAAVAVGASLRRAPPAQVSPPPAAFVAPPTPRSDPAPPPAMPTPSTSPARDDRPVTAPRRRPPPVVIAPPRDESLAAESAALLRARSLLAGDPVAALAALDAHADSFSRPQLADEREFMAVDALRRLGRAAEAEARAQALIARDPHGPYARRMRRDAAP